MPPACRFTREQIVAAALAITRERGFDAVTARAIADTLHSSSKVIFSAFSGMDDLLAATIDAADAQYRAYSADFVRDSADPPYIISIRRQRSRAFSPSGVTRCMSCITPYCC